MKFKTIQFYLVLSFLLIGALNGLCQNNKLSPANEANELTEYQQAKEYLDTRKYPEAEPLLKGLTDKFENKKPADYLELLNLYAKSIMHQWRTDEALEIYEKMHLIAKAENLSVLHADAMFALIAIYNFKEEVEKVRQLCLEGMAITDLEQNDVSDLYISYSQVLKQNNKIDSAIYYAQQAYTIDKDIKDTISLPRTCHTLGTHYSTKGDFHKALAFFIEGKEMLLPGRSHHKSTYSTDIARTFIGIRNLKKAKQYAEDGITLAKENNLVSGLAKSLTVLAEIYELDGKYEKAVELYTESAEINLKPKKQFTQVLNSIGIISCKLRSNKKIEKEDITKLLQLKQKSERQSTKNKIDLCYLEYKCQNKLTLQEFNLLHSELLSKCKASNNIFHLRDLAKVEYNFLSERDNFKQANKALETYYAYEDLLREEEQDFALLDLEAKYDKQTKERQIDLLANTNELQNTRLKQQKSFLIIGSAGFAFISMLFFFIYNLYKKVSSQNLVISETLKTKDILLREIHHRVKNNLQVISSLLSLQSRQIEDIGTKQAIKEGRSRVRSMALIHQNLYQNDNLTGVSVSFYLNKLIEELFETYKIENDRVVLEMDIDDIELDVDTMVPFGLIANELVSNCLKHAFPQKTTGKITVKLKDQDNNLFLSVRDNGIGVDEEKLVNSKSFGNKLLKAFTQKLHGNLEVINDSGTTVNLTIKNYKKVS